MLFRGEIIDNAKFNEADFSGTYFFGASVKDADFNKAYFKNFQKNLKDELKDRGALNVPD